MPSNPVSREVGKCIYCGTTEGQLSREHIIPRGLDGKLLLRKASCAACAAITSDFERECLRVCFPGLRAHLGMRSGKSGAKNYRFTVQVGDGKNSGDVDIDARDFSGLAVFPTFQPPKILSGDTKEGFIMDGFLPLMIGSIPEDIPQFSGKTTPSEPWKMMQMMGKIGLGAAIFKYGHDAFDEIYLNECLINPTKNLPQWIGCVDHDIEETPYTHRLIDKTSDQLVAFDVQLFAYYGAPKYRVVVGMLKQPDQQIESG